VYQLKLIIYKKKKCVVGYLFEREQNSFSSPPNSFHEAIPLDEIEDYYVEQTHKGFTLIIERGINYKAFYVVDHYSSRKEAESAAKILIL